ncbi:alcohol dehydrogenase [Helicobacter sp. 16-1353]|nr:alcohol dehydrogenase [Helicobacter sp. 16-1353]
MKAVVYHGKANDYTLDTIDKPKILKDTDAIVKITTTTICGTDLHISHGHVDYMTEDIVLGHEGVGIVEEVGSGVSNFKKGDRVIISCVTSCGKCEYCKRGLYAHCKDGGWILGHKINGTQAEYVRIPHADNSLYALPKGLPEEKAVMLSDILPTGYEIGVKYGKISPSQTVAIVGSGPIGIAALMTAQFYSPSKIIMVDLDDKRLDKAVKIFGATHKVNSKNQEEAIKKIFEITDGKGVDVALEAVGFPATFDLCQRIINPGGHVSVLGVHGKPVQFNLNELWIKNITLSTGLVCTFTIPELLQGVVDGKIKADSLSNKEHRSFKLSKICDKDNAWDVFSNAAKHDALKVIVTNDIS